MDRLLLTGVIVFISLTIFLFQYLFLRKKYGTSPKFWVIIDFIWIFLAVISASLTAGEKVREVSNTTNKYAVDALTIDAINIREIVKSLSDISPKLSQSEIKSLTVPYYLSAHFSAIYDAAKLINEKKAIHDSPNSMADDIWNNKKDVCLSILPNRNRFVDYAKSNIKNNKAFYEGQFADFCGVLNHFVETAAEENRRNAEIFAEDNFRKGPTRFYVVVLIFAACLRLHKSVSDYVKISKI